MTESSSGQPPADPWATPPGWDSPQPPAAPSYAASPVPAQPPKPYAAPADWQPPPPPYAAPPAWQPPPPPYAAPPGGYSPYGPPPGYGAYPRPGNTNGFAIAALVVSIVGGVIPYLGAFTALIFGIVGLRQTRERGEGGRGLAIAGIVIAVIGIVLWTAIFVTAGLSGGNSSGSGGLST